jgi:hypothetical protein
MKVQDGMRVSITYQIKENKIKMAIANFYYGDIYLPLFYIHCFQIKPTQGCLIMMCYQLHV